MGATGRRQGYLAPSLLSADHAHLADAVALVQEHAGALHLDFMDAHFVPTLAFAPEVVGALKRVTALPLRCHLMVSAPERLVDVFADGGADLFTAHVECGEAALRALERARERGMRTGLALKLGTPIAAVEPELERLDAVLVMSIEPGWSGQPFEERALGRIEAVHALIDDRGLAVEVEVDGGVNEQTGRRCIEAGATVLAAASAVFQAEDPAGAAQRLAAAAAGA